MQINVMMVLILQAKSFVSPLFFSTTDSDSVVTVAPSLSHYGSHILTTSVAVLHPNDVIQHSLNEITQCVAVVLRYCKLKQI